MWVGLHLSRIPGLFVSYKEFVITSIATDILIFFAIDRCKNYLYSFYYICCCFCTYQSCIHSILEFCLRGNVVAMENKMELIPSIYTGKF